MTSPYTSPGSSSSGQAPAAADASAGIVDQTQQKVGQAVDQAQQKVGQAVDQAQQKLGPAVDQAQQTAGQLTEQAKQQATSRLESQKDRAVDSLVTVAQALRQTGQHLREQEQGGIAEYVEQAAERVEGLTNHLRARDVPQLLADTEDVARRRPALFLGTALALGFVGARFLMSSGQRARAQRSTSGIGAASGAISPYAGQPGAYGRPPVVPPTPAHSSFDVPALPRGGAAGSTGPTVA